MAKIGFVSDIHLGYKKVNRSELISRLKRLSTEFETQDVEYVISLGDQIHEQSREEDLENLEIIHSIFSNNNYGFYPLIGNHDVEFINGSDFYNIFGISSNYYITLSSGESIVCIDTGSVNPLQHIGQLSDQGMDLAEEFDNPIVCTHYPITYTSLYQSSPFFDQYPEGVFAINKSKFEERRENGSISPKRIFTGHLHLDTEYTDDFGVVTNIVPPFINFTDSSPDSDAVIYNTQTETVQLFSV